MRCLAYRAQKMVLHQRSVTLVPNLLNGARSGPATGRMFAIAVTVVAKLRVLKFLSSRVARAFRKVAVKRTFAIGHRINEQVATNKRALP